ncbi:MAG: XRE family transcriptional regulator [Spirochaetia bacterium]|nr:XRE family transcriptional regulator [Spirochaetia bacterium]
MLQKEIGERIAELRGEQTQEELATQLFISRERLSMWEQGRRMLKAPDIIQLANHFKVSTDYLLFGVNPDQISAHLELGLSQDAINNLRSFKEKDLIEGTDEPAGKCAALSRALSSWSVVNIVASLLMLKGSKPGHYDGMMPSLPVDGDPSTAGDFYEGWLSPDTYAAALSHCLYLTLESIRKGEGGELPVYEPYEREMERTIEERRKSGRLIEEKGDQDGTPTEQG